MALHDDSDDETHFSAYLSEEKHDSGEGNSTRYFMVTGDQRMLIRQRSVNKMVILYISTELCLFCTAI